DSVRLCIWSALDMMMQKPERRLRHVVCACGPRVGCSSPKAAVRVRFPAGAFSDHALSLIKIAGSALTMSCVPYEGRLIAKARVGMMLTQDDIGDVRLHYCIFSCRN